MNWMIIIRLGTEHHDIYTYGPWQQIHLGGEDLWNFAEAEKAANAWAIKQLETEWSGCWQISSITRDH